ncbi:unnamed protein product [Sphagnum compactum]
MSSIFGGSNSSNQSQSQSASSNQAYPMLSSALGAQTTTGTSANNQLASLLGLNGTAAQTGANGAFQNFQNSTGYQFGLNQGTQAITQNAAASGLLDSGSTAKALDTYGQNYANTQYQNYTNQLAGLTNTGNQAGSVISGAGNQSASQSVSSVVPQDVDPDPNSKINNQVTPADLSSVAPITPPSSTDPTEVAGVTVTAPRPQQTGSSPAAGYSNVDQLNAIRAASNQDVSSAYPNATAAGTNNPIANFMSNHGTLRSILGTLGDAFLIQAGHQPMYHDNVEQAKIAQAAAGFDTDPLGAASRVAATGAPGSLPIAQEFANQYNTQQLRKTQMDANNSYRQGMLQDRDIATQGQANIRQQQIEDRTRQMMGGIMQAAAATGDPKQYAAARQRALALGSGRIKDFDPDIEVPENIQDYGTGYGMTANSVARNLTSNASIGERATAATNRNAVTVRGQDIGAGVQNNRTNSTIPSEIKRLEQKVNSGQTLLPAKPLSGTFDPSSAKPVQDDNSPRFDPVGDFQQGLSDIGNAAHTLAGDWGKKGVPGVVSTVMDTANLVGTLANPLTNIAVHPAAQYLANKRAQMFASGYNPNNVPVVSNIDKAIGQVAPSLVDKSFDQNPEEALRTGLNSVAGGILTDGAFKIADRINAAKVAQSTNANLTAASAGVPPSDFVSNLFQKRGVDTTPAADPRGVTTPLTGQGLSAKELQDYHQVLQTGTEQDIRGFFDGRNVQPPSFEATHDWVSRRDGQGALQADVSPEDLTNQIVGTPDLRQPVNDYIQEATKNWKNAPEYEVINHTDDIVDPVQRAQAVAQGADDSDILGFLGTDGKVRIFANKLGTTDPKATLNAVLYHESLGHYGLVQQFGDKLDSTINTLLSRNVNKLAQDTDTWMKNNPGAYNGNRTRAAEEVLANMSNNGTLKPSLADALTAHVARFARKMGLNIGITDAEVREVLNMAHQAVIKGPERDVVGNNFRTGRTPSEMRIEGAGGAQVPTEAATPSDNFMTPDDIAKANAQPTLAEHEAANGPYIAKPEEFPTENPYKQTTNLDPEDDGFIKPEQINPDGSVKFIRRSNLAPKDVAEEAYDRLNAEYVPTKRSWAETAKLAADTALSPEMIKESRSVSNLDRKLFVYDAAAREANDKLREIGSRADENGVLSPEDHAAAIATAAHFNYVLGRIENDSRQIARGLNAMKAVRFSRNNLIALQKALAESGTNMDALTDPDTMLKFLRQYNQMAKGNPKGAANMLASVAKPYWWQYLLTFRQNMMLSGLSTHLKSTMDMATMIGRELQESTLALPGSAVRETLRSMGIKNIQPGAHPTELANSMYSLMRSAIEASTYKDTWNALKGNSTTAPRYANIADPHIPIVSKVTDLVSAQDTFFRSFLVNYNLRRIGTREAYESLKAQGNGKVNWFDAITKGTAIALNPTPEMIDQATAETERTILLNRSPLNAGIDKLRVIRPGMDGLQQAGSFAMNLLTPFIRVGANALWNQIIRRSPLAILDKDTRADFAAGGARADIATARIAMGTALMGYYWLAADPKNNKVEGDAAGENYAKLQEKMASGYTPNSIHDGDRYNKTSNLNISFNPLDLHNNIATTIAGIREAYQKGADTKNVATAFQLAMVQIMHSISNQSFVNDITPNLDAISDKQDTTGQKVGKLVNEQIRTFLPNATTQLAHVIDPISRDTRSDNIVGGLVKPVVNNLPGISKILPARSTVYGEDEKNGTDLAGVHNWITPGNGQQEVSDPAEKELARLGSLTKAAVVTPVQSSIRVEGANLKLTPAQQDEYQKYTGQTIVQAVREQQQSGDWDKMSDQDKIKFVRSTQTEAKKQYFLIGVLFLGLVFTYHEWEDTKASLKIEKASHAADIASYKKAQADANAEAVKEKQELLTQSKAEAHEADANYTTILNGYKSNLLRYKQQTSGSRTQSASTSQYSDTTQDSNGSSTSSVVPQITITTDDANICAINTARLQAAHDWALQLEKDNKTDDANLKANSDQSPN